MPIAACSAESSCGTFSQANTGPVFFAKVNKSIIVVISTEIKIIFQVPLLGCLLRQEQDQ